MQKDISVFLITLVLFHRTFFLECFVRVVRYVGNYLYIGRFIKFLEPFPTNKKLEFFSVYIYTYIYTQVSIYIYIIIYNLLILYVKQYYKKSMIQISIKKQFFDVTDISFSLTLRHIYCSIEFDWITRIE